MNIKLKKALGDIRSNPGGSALVVFALVIGLWGLGSLSVSGTILRSDLRENFLKTGPPHAVLFSRDFGRLDLPALRKGSDIESAEFRDLSLQRIEVYPDQWIPLWLFGVEDFDSPAMARFYQEEGVAVPQPGSMLMERDGRLISGLRLGSKPRVRVGGRIWEIPVAGICFDPAQPPATQDHFIYAYVDKVTYARITGSPVNQRLLLRISNASKTDDVRKAVDRIIADLAAKGISVDSVTIPKFNEHPHQWQLNTLLLLQGSIGFMAFLIGAVMVSQLMSAIMSRQVRQIGIMKSMGASRRDILTIYAGMTLLFGGASSLVAIPLAVSTGFAFSRFVASKLNFNLLTTNLPLSQYAALAILGLMLPLLFSLPAIFRGMRVSVLLAISDYGISPIERYAKGGVAVCQGYSSAGLAFRNVLRRKQRLAITVVTMALGAAIFCAGFNVRQSLQKLLADLDDSMGYDVQVVLGSQMPRESVVAPFRSLGNLDRIEAYSGGIGELQSTVVSTEDHTGIIALPHDTDLIRPRIEEGRWLLGGGRSEVVLNRKAVEKYGNPRVGDILHLRLSGRQVPFRLVGVVWELDKPKIYMDQDRFDAIANPGRLVNSLMFVAKDKGFARVVEMKREIERVLATTDLPVLYVMSKGERVKVVYDHLNIILTTIVLLALTVLLVSGMGMASATGINISERTREIGVMRAIGATPQRIYRLFVTEGMIVSLAGILLGLLLAWPLSMAASRFFGGLMLGEGAMLRYALSPAGLWITAGTTFLLGWLASLMPARKAIRVPTKEALAYE